MKNAGIAGLLIASLTGCALLSKGEVPVRRYFSPDLRADGSAAPSPRSGAELRLGRVTAGAAIAERIMFRESEHEVGFYEDRSWTEKPEAYLRRGLTRVLFEEQGLRSVMRGAGPVLEVELISFEEVRSPVHLGRVRVAFSLSDERIVSLQQTFTVERPILASSSPPGEGLAEAMGQALGDAVQEISERVISDLSKTAAAAR